MRSDSDARSSSSNGAMRTLKVSIFSVELIYNLCTPANISVPLTYHRRTIIVPFGRLVVHRWYFNGALIVRSWYLNLPLEYVNGMLNWTTRMLMRRGFDGGSLHDNSPNYAVHHRQFC